VLDSDDENKFSTVDLNRFNIKSEKTSGSENKIAIERAGSLPDRAVNERIAA
jgi:hypothetical protein